MENKKQYYEINYVDIYKSIKNIKGMSFEEVAENTLNAMKKAINECNDKLKEIDKNVYYHKLVDGYLGYVSVYDTNTKERKDIEVTIQKDEDKKDMQKAVDIVVERFKKNLLYEAEIDKVLSKETVRQKEETNYIKICNTPDVFKSIGLEDKDITIKRNKIRICNLPKEEGGHNITKEIYYKLPELFQSPAYILKSKTEAKSVVAMLNEIDDEKMPILVAIKPDEKGIYEFQTIDTNLLKSIYGRDKFEKFINDNKENLLFKDDKQIAELNEKIGIMQAAKNDDLELK